MKTITEIRESFWTLNHDFASHRRSKKRQNDYNATIRTAFCDYLDYLCKSRQISEKLAGRATL